MEKKLRSGTLDFFEDSEDYTEDEEDIKIVKNKHFSVMPMDAEEAVLQMNLLGHQFFIFREMHTGDINVVYRRKDGNYGLICPEE